jgi:hypothetical protein
MFAGPKVDIYVGPQSKHFSLPKDILCYHSSYFDRCFNGGFKEAKEKKLVLTEDRVEHFQHILDYMFRNGGDPINIKGDWKLKMNYYMEFIEYIGKYDLLGAFQMVSDDLNVIIGEANKLSMRLDPAHIEVVFRVFPDGHPLRASVTMMAVRHGFVEGFYTTQEKMVNGFAAEILTQLRKQNSTVCFWRLSVQPGRE